MKITGILPASHLYFLNGFPLKLRLTTQRKAFMEIQISACRHI